MTPQWVESKEQANLWEKQIGDHVRLRVAFVGNDIDCPWQYNLEVKLPAGQWSSVSGGFSPFLAEGEAMAERLLKAPLDVWLNTRRQYVHQYSQRLDRIAHEVETYQRKAEFISQIKEKQSFVSPVTLERYLLEGYLYKLKGIPYLQPTEEGDGNPSILSEHEMLCHGMDCNSNMLTFFLSRSPEAEKIEVAAGGKVVPLKVEIGHWENDGTVKFVVCDVLNRSGQGSYVLVAVTA